MDNDEYVLLQSTYFTELWCFVLLFFSLEYNNEDNAENFDNRTVSGKTSYEIHV